MKSKKEIILDLLDKVETNLKTLINSSNIENNSVEISDYNLSSVSLNWLNKFSNNILPTHKKKIIESFFIEEDDFNAFLINKLHNVKESFFVDCDDRLNKIYSECIDFNLFMIGLDNIRINNSKFRSLESQLGFVNDRAGKKKEKEKEEEELFEFFINNIDVLLMVECVFKIIYKKLSFRSLESDFKKDVKDKVEVILGVFNNSEYTNILVAVDFTSFNIIEKFEIDVDENFEDDIEKLIENHEIVEFIVNFIKTFESNLYGSNGVAYQVNTNYLNATRFYGLEKKLLNKNIEVNDLKLKLSGLSMIDKNLTNKNEFYNKVVGKLFEVEDGFNLVLDYYNKLLKDDFTAKEWAKVDSVKNTLKNIVDCFKVKSIYQYFLLLDEIYIDSLLKYFKDEMIDGVRVNWEDEKSQKIINDFHVKMVDPETFIKLKREDWNTPLFLFNLNYYALIKDYKHKYKNIESLDKDIANYIKSNGDFKRQYEDYIQKISHKTQEARQSVSNIVCQYNQVAALLSNVEKSESFIKEIEGLYINNETRKVYQTVFDEELKVANRFRTVSLFIYGFLGVVAFISLCVLLFASSTSDYLTRLTDIDTLLVKLSLILTLVFIGVYLSREGEKHRRIANQARQTMNELHAFSSYSTDIKDKIPEIKTKLADKYFGKNLYETEKAMTPDSDVLKSVIDQAKATTDLVKAFKGTITPDTSSQDSGKNKSSSDQNV